MPVLDVADIIVGESDAVAVFTLRLDSPATVPLQLGYSLRGGSGIAGLAAPEADFTNASGSVVFAPGETERTLQIPLRDDSLVEGLERLHLLLTLPPLVQQPLTLGRSGAMVLIHDNDTVQAQPSLEVDDVFVDEGAGAVRFVVRLGGPAGGAAAAPVSVRYATADGSAQDGQDYSAMSGMLSFAPGENVKVVSVPLLNDDTAEGIERFSLQLSQAQGATLAQASALAEIGLSDGVAVSQPRLVVADVVAGEGDRFVDVVLRLQAPATTTFGVQPTMMALVPGLPLLLTTDLLSITGLSFAPGETLKVLRIGLYDDTSPRGPVSADWMLSTAFDGTLLRQVVGFTIYDNDTAAAQPEVFVDDLVVDEQAGVAEFVVRLGQPLGQASAAPVTVHYATRDGSAVAGQDYLAAQGSLWFAPGETVQRVRVDLLDDPLAEGRERFELVLAGASGAVLADGAAQAEIGPSDGTPVAQPFATMDELVIDETSGRVSAVVRLSAPSPNEVVLIATVGNPYLSPTDLSVGLESSTLLFAPGETTKTLSFTVLDDAVVEALESASLGLVGVQNVTPTATVLPLPLHDNDQRVARPQLYVEDLGVDERAGTALFAVSLGWRGGTATDQPVTVAYRTEDGSATAGLDYVARSGTLSFRPGETVKTVAIDLLDDTLAEAGERFTLRLTEATQADLAQAAAQAFIAPSDAPPSGQTPRLSISDATVSERDRYVDLWVTLDAPATVPVSYLVTATSATATAGPDFLAPYLPRETLQPGQTMQRLRIELGSDTSPEALEHFTVTLSAHPGVALAKATGVVSIVDDDSASALPELLVRDAVVDETAGTASFVVQLGRDKGAASNQTVRVGFATADGTALAGQDFRAHAGTLVFAPGETVQTVVVDILDDTLREATERFALQLSAPVNATLLDAHAVGLIGANDAPAVARPQLSAGGGAVSEADGYLDLAFFLDTPATGIVQATPFVSAVFGADMATPADYRQLGATLTFLPGQTTATARVALLQDTLAERDKGLLVSVQASAATQGAAQALTIVDDDSDLSRAVLSFGRSDDLYHPATARDLIVESAGGGIDTVVVGWDLSLPEHLENLRLTGSTPLRATGNAAMNLLAGNAGNNSLDGAGGIDTAVFAAPLAQASVSGGNGSFVVSSAADGIDTLSSIERLRFADVMRADDTAPGGNTYLACALLNAALDALPGTALLSQWTAQLDLLGSLRDTAQALINFYAPGIADELLVAHLWNTVVEAPPSAADLAGALALLRNGSFTQASLLAFVATHPLNTAELAGVAGQPMWLDPAWFPMPGG